MKEPNLDGPFGPVVALPQDFTSQMNSRPDFPKKEGT